MAAFLVLALTGAPSHAATILIDKTFDGNANDTGPDWKAWQTNASSGATKDLSTGTIATGEGNWVTFAFMNTGTVDLSGATSFTATFNIDEWYIDDRNSVNGYKNLGANGYFLGIVSGGNATTDGQNYRSQDYAFGHILGRQQGLGSVQHRVFENNLADNNDQWATSAGTLPSPASVDDGFSISMTLNNDDTWSMTSTGLDVNINTSGSLNYWTYNDFVSGGVGLLNSAQNRDGGANKDITWTISRATLTAATASTVVPEPSVFGPMMALGALMLLLRRRRG